MKRYARELKFQVSQKGIDSSPPIVPSTTDKVVVVWACDEEKG